MLMRLRNLKKELQKHFINNENIRFAFDKDEFLDCFNQEYDIPVIIIYIYPRSTVLRNENGDLCLKDQSHFKDYINIEIPKQVKRIYLQHCNVFDNIFNCLPLGVSHSEIENIVPQLIGTKVDKEHLVYSNFNYKLTKFRKYLFNNKKDFIFYDPIMENLHRLKQLHKHLRTPYSHEIYLNYCENIYKSKFCLCPQGHRPDTFRFWEALYLDSIPIVLNNNDIYKYFNNDIPFLVVEDYDQLTKDYLEDQYKIISKKQYNKNNMLYNYWIKRIKTDLETINE